MLGIPWPGINLPILGVVPVLFLMFFVRPSIQRGNERRNACSKCASPHVRGQNFCTKCGWDLSDDYSPDTADTVLASEVHQPQAASAATLERPAEPAPPEVNGGTGQVQEQQPSIMEESAPDSEPTLAPASEEAYASATDRFEQEEASSGEDAGISDEPATKPWGMPVLGPAPTAEVMTARGTALLGEGKLQEAIDQFTKAIALDPKYREALEQRAEAYTRQGRRERAEEDHRQVQALNTGS